ncbi:DUF663-domain-containing protein [Patellaria atrata CBS 101060]|uniref:DUF663-domain-containing protein n=1 Tax=Patellaria atrata CBS 101060 TaxID=1346257 RepID=A0A9P4S3Q2_9PEZI|nr:DUF663-domain-containing protein [Patellaria atrata CBS 101060]
MAPIVDHHHRSTTKSSHKPFKARHATKSALKEKSKGKVEHFEKGSRKTPHQQVMSKLDRRNQAKQKRLLNHHDHIKATSLFSGRDGAPRIVAVIPVCRDVSGPEVVRSLNKSVDLDEQAPELGYMKANIERFKQKIEYVIVSRDIMTILNACRAAEFVLFVLSANEEVDDVGELILRTVESQGVSNVITVVQNLEKIEPAKRRPQLLSSLKSYITHFYPTQEKVYSLDSRQDCANVLRSLCTLTPKGIKWREDRSWMLVEDVRWSGGKKALIDGNETGEVILSGIVRGKGLKADRLVQVGDWGDFQIEKIVAAPLGGKKAKGEDMALDEASTPKILDHPTEDQDDMNELAPEEAVMEDVDDTGDSAIPTGRKGVLLDDHHYFSDEEAYDKVLSKRLPRGTSKYQAAWYLGDVSDSGSDLEDVDESMFDGPTDGLADPADGMEGVDFNQMDPTEAGPSEYPPSEMFLDPSPDEEAEQLTAYRAQRKDAKEDLEFPDEVELHPHVSARERLARYRGLKSLRTSTWETEEDRPYEPEEWRRLLEISNYKVAKSRVLREALVGGVKPGTHVLIYLRNVPLSLQHSYDPSQPLALFSLHRHEHKRTAVNYSITLSSDYEAPLKSKEELILQCGPRRFIINPLFSQAGNTSNDVHKFDRYLHPGRSAIATFTAPLTWGSVPALFFKRVSKEVDISEDDNEMDTTITQITLIPLRLVATGTSLPPSTNRVIAKRAILTGHPYKIHKKLVTVRYMFFNAEDVAWFKALQLWTKRGRSGYIKESLGTHGYFKATFDGKINPMDAVGMSLYKRVWPRPARVWKGFEMEDEKVEQDVMKV